jgi:hypothetical protein
MSKRYLSITSLLTISAVLMSCTERTAPTDTAPTTPPVLDDFINGPGSPGNSGIFRFQDVYFEVAVDGNAGLISLHGLQNTVADLCADLGEFDLGDIQLKPHSAGEVNGLVMDGTSSVQILALAPVTCEDLSGAPVLYSGTATFHRTDNNQTQTGSEGGRANSWGWTAQGVLDDLVNGGQVHYSEEVRFNINPRTGEFTVLVSNIRVN